MGYDIEAIKKYEAVSTSRKAEKGLPLVVRLDGRAFHTFTMGLVKKPENNDSTVPMPFHQGLSDLMVETTKYLVKEFSATVAYTQSDEISLIFLPGPNPESQLIFDGRFQKIESISAAMTTAFFMKNLPKFVPEKQDKMPVFDSRAYTVPNVQEAFHFLQWRQRDATRNAVSTAARLFFSQNQLFEKSSREMRTMLLSSRFHINFEDYPYHFKRGVFARRVPCLLDPSKMTDIPEKYRPTSDIVRSKIEIFDVDFVNEKNPIDVLFCKKNELNAS